MVILTILGIILLLIGLIGCVVPIIPGPPLSFIAMILLQIARHGEAFTTNQLVFWGIVTIAVTALDYIIPIAGAKKYGASKAGIWGSIIGMLSGLIFFPPFGMFLGAFIGAIIGELLIGKNNSSALKAGFGTFIGTMTGFILKIIAGFGMGYYFFKALF